MGRMKFYTLGLLMVVVTTLALLPACGGGKPTSTITPVAAVKITTHPINVQAFADCQSCHATGTNGAKKNPDDHSKYTNKDCTICHKP